MATIRDYYEDRSPEYARPIVSRLFESVSRLEDFPCMGRQVPEIGNEAFWELIVEGFRVVYLALEDGSEVEPLAIAHSRQDLVKKLARR
ncbi:MAG: type II toxin-antitoxin system RelE/ParE family toxin [Bacteroidota bacterium]